MTYFTGTHDLLVVIDQHAAHERVRLEAFTAGNKIANFHLSRQQSHLAFCCYFIVQTCGKIVLPLQTTLPLQLPFLQLQI